MSVIDAKLATLGFALPPPLKAPEGITMPFSWVRTWGDRVFVSGHGPVDAEGNLLGPLGRVGAEVSEREAYLAARHAALAILGSLKRELGDLDRIAAWLTVSGMVNVAPGFHGTTNVINGCSDLLLLVFGPVVGGHARTAVGLAELPLNLPVVISAELAVRV